MTTPTPQDSGAASYSFPGPSSQTAACLAAALITTDDAFAALEKEWDELLDATTNASVFQSWEWSYTWWETFREGKELRIIALRDGGQRLAGLWPLYVRQVRLMRGLRLAEVRLLGTGQEVSPDYMGPLATPEAESQVVPALLEWLSRSADEWDKARLTDVRSDAWWLSALAHEIRKAGMHASEEPRARCLYVQLPPSFGEYLQQLDRGTRHDLRRRTRLLHRNCAPEFFRWESGMPAEEGIETIAELHRRRRDGTGDRLRAFRTPGYMGFHRLLASRLEAKDWLDLYGVRIDGRAVSMLYGMTYRGVLSLYQAGFDPLWGKHGVGTILRAHVLEDAIRRGLREVDFLKGEHEYKGRWTNAERRTVDMIVNNANAMGDLEYVQRNVSQHLKQAARRYLPAPVVRLAKKARSLLRQQPRMGSQ